MSKAEAASPGKDSWWATIIDELDIEMLADAKEESNSITTTLGFIAAATAATAAGLFIARLKCSKKDEDFERVLAIEFKLRNSMISADDHTIVSVKPT